MGLDWNPANKPRPGHEEEFWRLFEELGAEGENSEEKIARFGELSISAFETLGAPRVGIDEVATAWAREVHAEQGVETPVDEWIASLEGMYVVPLVAPCDGVPRYSNGTVAGYVEPFAFRAQFLKDCEYIIGEELLERAFQHMKPEALRAFGGELADKARAHAREHGIDLDAIGDPEDPDAVEFHLDVVLAASRWCLFWAERGHPLEAYW